MFLSQAQRCSETGSSVKVTSQVKTIHKAKKEHFFNCKDLLSPMNFVVDTLKLCLKRCTRFFVLSVCSLDPASNCLLCAV